MSGPKLRVDIEFRQSLKKPKQMASSKEFTVGWET